MIHPIYRVRAFQTVAPYTLRVQFDDGSEQVINFQPILAGELFEPLRDLALFNQVRIDPERCTHWYGRTEPNLTRPRSTIGLNTSSRWRPAALHWSCARR